MSHDLQEALRKREAELGRKLTPDEFQEVRRMHETSGQAKSVRVLEDEDDYLDPQELHENAEPITVLCKPSQTANVEPVRTHNPTDDRLGNLSGTPRPTSTKKNWDKRTNRKYKRRDVTDVDLRIISFLARFKFSNSRQAAQLLGVKVNTAHRRLLGLQEVGLVSSEEVLGAKLVWRTTKKGNALADSHNWLDEDEYTLTRTGDAETSQLGHYLGVNQVAIQILAGSLEWFSLDDSFATEQPTLACFLTEFQVRSAWEAWKASNNMAEWNRMPSSAFRYSARPTTERLHREIWQSLSYQEDQEDTTGILRVERFREEHPEVWTLGRGSTNQTAGLYHHADLIYLPQERAIAPVAFEVEVNMKKLAEYKRALASYRDNTAKFEHVVWVCGSLAIAKRVTRAAEEVGIDLKDFMKIAPLRNFDGSIFSGKAWRL